MKGAAKRTKTHTESRGDTSWWKVTLAEQVG